MLKKRDKDAAADKAKIERIIRRRPLEPTEDKSLTCKRIDDFGFFVFFSCGKAKEKHEGRGGERGPRWGHREEGSKQSRGGAGLAGAGRGLTGLIKIVGP